MNHNQPLDGPQPFLAGLAPAPPPTDVFTNEPGNMGLTTHNADSFRGSLEAFLISADWLTAEDGPAIVTLRCLASTLDYQLNPQLLAQFGLAYRSLLKRKPTGDAPSDPLEAALRAEGV